VNFAPSGGRSGFFKATFVLPENYSNAQLFGSANVDDFGRAFLNGQPLSPALNSNEPGRITQSAHAVFQANDPSLFKAGFNELIIADWNSGGGPSGAGFYAIVTFQFSTPRPQLINPRIADGKFHFDFQAVPSMSYDVEASTSLTGDWNKIQSVTAASSTVTVSVDFQSIPRHRYFRIVARP
jgi:hypothetical protein